MKSNMFNQVMEVGEIMGPVGFQDDVLISARIPLYAAHPVSHPVAHVMAYMALRLKLIDLPSSEINCFRCSFYLSWTTGCDAGEMFTQVSAFFLFFFTFFFPSALLAQA